MTVMRKPRATPGMNLKYPEAPEADPSKENKLTAAQTSPITQPDPRGLVADVGRAGLRSLYKPAVPLTEGGFCDWIANAMVGQSIEYHEGFLLRDRSETVSELPTKERARLHAVARRAWIACELGLVHLVSLKVEEARYRYIAVRSTSTLKPPEIRTRLRVARTTPSQRKSH